MKKIAKVSREQALPSPIKPKSHQTKRGRFSLLVSIGAGYDTWSNGDRPGGLGRDRPGGLSRYAWCHTLSARINKSSSMNSLFFRHIAAAPPVIISSPKSEGRPSNPLPLKPVAPGTGAEPPSFEGQQQFPASSPEEVHQYVPSGRR